MIFLQIIHADGDNNISIDSNIDTSLIQSNILNTKQIDENNNKFLVNGVYFSNSFLYLNSSNDIIELNYDNNIRFISCDLITNINSLNKFFSHIDKFTYNTYFTLIILFDFSQITTEFEYDNLEELFKYIQNVLNNNVNIHIIYRTYVLNDQVVLQKFNNFNKLFLKHINELNGNISHEIITKNHFNNFDLIMRCNVFDICKLQQNIDISHNAYEHPLNNFTQKYQVGAVDFMASLITKDNNNLADILSLLKSKIISYAYLEDLEQYILNYEIDNNITNILQIENASQIKVIEYLKTETNKKHIDFHIIEKIIIYLVNKFIEKRKNLYKYTNVLCEFIIQKLILHIYVFDEHFMTMIKNDIKYKLFMYIQTFIREKYQLEQFQNTYVNNITYNYARELLQIIYAKYNQNELSSTNVLQIRPYKHDQSYELYVNADFALKPSTTMPTYIFSIEYRELFNTFASHLKYFSIPTIIHQISQGDYNNIFDNIKKLKYCKVKQVQSYISNAIYNLYKLIKDMNMSFNNIIKNIKNQSFFVNDDFNINLYKKYGVKPINTDILIRFLSNEFEGFMNVNVKSMIEIIMIHDHKIDNIEVQTNTDIYLNNLTTENYNLYNHELSILDKILNLNIDSLTLQEIDLQIIFNCNTLDFQLCILSPNKINEIIDNYIKTRDQIVFPLSVIDLSDDIVNSSETTKFYNSFIYPLINIADYTRFYICIIQKFQIFSRFNTFETNSYINDIKELYNDFLKDCNKIQQLQNNAKMHQEYFYILQKYISKFEQKVCKFFLLLRTTIFHLFQKVSTIYQNNNEVGIVLINALKPIISFIFEISCNDDIALIENIKLSSSIYDILCKNIYNIITTINDAYNFYMNTLNNDAQKYDFLFDYLAFISKSKELITDEENKQYMQFIAFYDSIEVFNEIFSQYIKSEVLNNNTNIIIVFYQLLLFIISYKNDSGHDDLNTNALYNDLLKYQNAMNNIVEDVSKKNDNTEQQKLDNNVEDVDELSTNDEVDDDDDEEDEEEN